MRRLFSGRDWRRTEGVSAVEFAIVLPLLMMILMGIIDYGWLFFLDLTLTNAAREGARVGVTQPVDTLVIDSAEKRAKDYLMKVNAEVKVTMPGDDVQVVVEIDPFVPLVGYLPASAFPPKLTATSIMRWEFAP